MPIIKSAKKAARQATKRNAKNREIKHDIKLAQKNFKANPTAENMRKIQSELDKAVKKDLLKKKTASRRKANLARLAKELNVKNTSVEKPKATKAAAPKTVKKAAPKTTKTTKPAAKTTKTKTAKKSEK